MTGQLLYVLACDQANDLRRTAAAARTWPARQAGTARSDSEPAAHAIRFPAGLTTVYATKPLQNAREPAACILEAYADRSDSPPKAGDLR